MGALGPGEKIPFFTQRQHTYTHVFMALLRVSRLRISANPQVLNEPKNAECWIKVWSGEAGKEGGCTKYNLGAEKLAGVVPWIRHGVSVLTRHMRTLRPQVGRVYVAPTPDIPTMASIHNNFARKQVGDTQKRGKPEMRSSCRCSTGFARLGRGCASVAPPQIPVSQSPC